MKARCRNPKRINYADYGGRGIKYDPRWEDYKNFLADMGERPEGMTLERINNDGNYELSNCRWATPKEQANNRRNTVSLEYQGEVKPLKQWAQEKGIKYITAWARWKKGWSASEILSTKKWGVEQ